MEHDNKIKLDEVISTAIDGLDALEDGSDEKKQAVEDLAKLYRLRIDEEKAIWESSEKLDRQDMEKNQHEADNKLREEDLTLREAQMRADNELRKEDLALREEQMKADKTHRYISYGLEAAGIVLPLIFYGTWMRRGFKFEENGTFTSTTFRSLFGKFKPTKK